jgi:hypothetical protein
MSNEFDQFPFGGNDQNDTPDTSLWGEALGADPFAPDDYADDFGSFEPLPPGLYAARIAGTVTKRTKAGTGILLVVELAISEGSYKGRKLWDYLNIKNPNETAQKIGRSRLASIGSAVGLKQIGNGDLDNRSVTVRVGVDGERNRVLAYRNYVPTSTSGQTETGGNLVDDIKKTAPPSRSAVKAPWDLASESMDTY